ncbi:hypothetical protein SUGI_0915140 [Cryptomeria japonica]|nr:hypothetical protein SUGI_0915140 [Cryptomeria japonica]
MNTQLSTFSVLQALTMDRHLGPHFNVPAASFFVFDLLAAAIILCIYEKVVPWANAREIKITKLMRIGIGVVISIVAVGVALIVERKRFRAVNAQVDSMIIVPLSAFWLLPQFIIIGVGEALQNVARIDFF